MEKPTRPTRPTREDWQRIAQLGRIIAQLDDAIKTESRPQILFASIRSNLDAAKLQMEYAVSKYLEVD